MKRFIQFVAVVVIALLAAQPALAGMKCEMGTPTDGQRAPCCHKAMSRMGMDCPMHHQVTASDCDQSCCNDALPQGVALLAAGVKPKVAKWIASQWRPGWSRCQMRPLWLRRPATRLQPLPQDTFSSRSSGSKPLLAFTQMKQSQGA